MIEGLVCATYTHKYIYIWVDAGCIAGDDAVLEQSAYIWLLRVQLIYLVKHLQEYHFIK